MDVKDTKKQLDALQKLTSNSISRGIQTLTGLDPRDEMMRRSLESAKRMAGIGGPGDEMMKRSLDSINSLERMTRLAGLGGPSDEMMKRSLDSFNSVERMTRMAGLNGPSDELKRSLAHASLLAHNVDHALSNMRMPAPHYDMFGPSLETPKLRELPPNPVLETNRQLAELTDTVTQLVSVARQQAELSQAIRNASDLALKNSIQSGEEAKAATRLAGKSVRLTFWAIIVTIVIAIFNIAFTTYENHRGDATAETRRQEEIRVLRDISGQLKGLSGQTPANPAAKPKSSQSSSTTDRARKGSASHPR